jgi:hypothetical protein
MAHKMDPTKSFANLRDEMKNNPMHHSMPCLYVNYLLLSHTISYYLILVYLLMIVYLLYSLFIIVYCLFTIVYLLYSLFII